MEQDLLRRIGQLEQAVQELARQRIGKNNIIPGSIEQRHMAASGFILSVGLAVNRPLAGTNTTLAYWATDTHVLSIWDGTIWRTQTFT